MEVNELEDAKTLKAVMFLMIQEHVRSIPNDQELGKEIRKVINKFNKNRWARYSRYYTKKSSQFYWGCASRYSSF